MRTFLLAFFLFAVPVIPARGAAPKKIFLSEADMHRLSKARKKGEYWTTKNGVLLVYTGNGAFKFTCQSDKRTPAATRMKKTKCWLNGTQRQLVAYLEAVKLAQSTKQTHDLDNMSCDSKGCWVVPQD